MPTTVNLAADVAAAAPGVAAIAIRGEINALCEERLMAAYSKAAEGKPRAIVLDFAGLEYMNSGGIGLLVTMLVRAQRQGVQLLAHGLNEHYRQIFELTRLDEAIGIYDTPEAALAAAAERRSR